jgi:hypothetical protein
MRLILLSLLLAFTNTASASDDSLKPEDYRLGERYGFSADEMKTAHKEAQKKVNPDAIAKQIADAFENDPYASAEILDYAISMALNKSYKILYDEDYKYLADNIEQDYLLFYKNYYKKQFLGLLEMGDHEPMSDWLRTVHKKIHDAIGEFICEQTHIHDLYILNHSIPVVFSPSSYTLKDYLDHFAGHLIWGWWWEHHGFAGVVTYWVIQGTCIGMTWGLGILDFVCSPIASLGEHIMDKRIAPDMGERIWQRAQERQQGFLSPTSQD